MADEHTKKPVDSVERTGQVNDGSPKMSYRHQKQLQRQLIAVPKKHDAGFKAKVALPGITAMPAAGDRQYLARPY
jgi:hypothetical protein